jgi:membrane-associated phospholipid phosphatase
MPFYSVVLLFIYTHFGLFYISRFVPIVLPALLFSFLVPAIAIFLLYQLGLISDLSLKRRGERFRPYLITLLSNGFMIYHYYNMGMPRWFVMLAASVVAVMIVAIVITLRWKISAHMFGIGGVLGGVMSVCYFVEMANPYFMFMGLFIIAGLVGTSRLILRRHTPLQVYAGFLLGFIISFAFVWTGAPVR